jgi:type IV secretion system protein VirD4
MMRHVVALLMSGARALAALARFGIHHWHAALILLALAAIAAQAYRLMLGRRAQVRRRVRALKWRIRLRLKPGAGYASLPELVFRWGRLAALHHGGRARPGLSFRARACSRTTDYAVRLGRTQWSRRAYARMEDQILVLAPQRTGKSGLIADQILSHPGAVLATSTRADLYQITAGARSRLGPVEVFNPQGVGGLRSTFSWDIIAPCRDLVMARRLAGWLTGASSGSGNHGNIEWFEKKGDVAMMGLLWAAAAGGYSITDVYRWVQLDGHENALRVLSGQPQLHAVVKRMLADNRTAGSVRDTIDLSLSWTVIPELAEAVTPAPGQGFDVGDFTRANGTLYMIASGDDESPLAPLFRAFASYVHYQAGLVGSMTPAGRLDPPLRMALDEVTTICPVDLPAMLSDSAGKGVLITAVAHGISQLEERWGEHGGKTIWACCATKILLGGISDADTLEDVSRLCGTIAVAGDDEDAKVRIVPPELLRALPDWRALVLRMNLFPVIVKFRPAWRRWGYRFGRAPVYIPRPAAVLAALPQEVLTPEQELAEILGDGLRSPSAANALERGPWFTRNGASDGR